MRVRGPNWGSLKCVTATMGSKAGKIVWGQVVMSAELDVQRLTVDCTSNFGG